MVGLSGGQDFAIWNSNFEEIKGPFKPTTLTEGFITQGVACDDDHIMFVLYKENVITVYDWEGNYVSLINLKDIPEEVEEPENISIVDGKIYITCAGPEGAKVYLVEPVKNG